MVPITNNKSITPEARLVIEKLNQFLVRPDVVSTLRRTKAEAEKRLAQHPDLASAFMTIDLVQLGWAAPEIGSARLVMTRESAGAATERHANSAQYLFVIDGPVETLVETTDGWRVDHYGEGDSANFENRWHFVPTNAWHRSMAPGTRNWTILAFHSAREVSDEYK